MRFDTKRREFIMLLGGTVIARIAPLLGLEPRFELPSSDKLILASAGGR